MQRKRLNMIVGLSTGLAIGAALVYLASHASWTTGTPIPLPAVWFNDGDESYGELMRNGNHLLWEATWWGVETLVLDLLVGLIAWPFIKRHFHRDIDRVESHEHRMLQALMLRVSDIDGLDGWDIMEGESDFRLTDPHKKNPDDPRE